MRRFEVVRDEFIKYGVDPKTLKKPVRMTKHAVCYDCFSPIDETIMPGETKLIFLNFKAYCNEDEGYIVAVRSGMGAKGIILGSGIGIIESDYADNPGNDGNIGMALHNMSDVPYVIKVGDRIGQIFFFKFLTCDDDDVSNAEVRSGGFGSTSGHKKQ